MRGVHPTNTRVMRGVHPTNTRVCERGVHIPPGYVKEVYIHHPGYESRAGYTPPGL